MIIEAKVNDRKKLVVFILSFEQVQSFSDHMGNEYDKYQNCDIFCVTTGRFLTKN